jgi:hypothetical protein
MHKKFGVNLQGNNSFVDRNLKKRAIVNKYPPNNI